MASIAERREQLLGKIPAHYSGWLHFVGINLSALAAIAGCVWLVEAPTWPQLALVPGFFVFANLFEWWVHKGPLHRLTPGLSILYKRHTKAHHVVFTDQRMEIESARELMLVLFPPYVLPLLILINAPLTAGLWLVHPNLAWLFLASALAYYLVYEWLHTFHHLPTESFVGRRAIVRALRRHHLRHHEPARMNDGNFNVSFPLADWLLGSVLRESEPRPSGCGVEDSAG